MDSIIKLAYIDGHVYVFISDYAVCTQIMYYRPYYSIDDGVFRLRTTKNVATAKENINLVYQDFLCAYKEIYDANRLPMFEYIGNNTWQVTKK